MPSHTLIENGTILDGTGAPPRPGAVLVAGSEIAALDDDATTQAKGINDCERIDATGLTVMPGLIDAHCHISFDEVASNDELFFPLTGY